MPDRPATPELAGPFEAIVEHSVDGLLVVDAEGIVVLANPAAERLLSGRTDRLTGFHFGHPAVDRAVELVIPGGSSPTVVEVRACEIDWHGEAATLASLRDVSAARDATRRLEHLNLVLHSIRRINQLITNEKDPQRLADNVCRCLVEGRGYAGAWLAVGDAEGPPAAIGQVGWGQEFEPLREQLRRGEWPPCQRLAGGSQDGLADLGPGSDCPSCPIGGGYQGQGAAVVELRHSDQVHGLLGVLAPGPGPLDREERAVLLEVASDVALALHDISSERRRRESEEQFRALFESMEQGATYHDIDTRILLANPAAQSMLGLTLDQLQERDSMDPRWRTVREDGSDLPAEEYPVNVALATGRAQRDVMGVFNPMENRFRWLNVHAVPEFREGDTRPFRAFVTFEDVTDLRAAHEALRANELFLVESGRLARVGGWHVDLASGTLEWTTVTREIHEVGDDYRPSLEAAFDFFHPEDRQLLRTAFEAAVERGEPYDLDLRFTTAKGRDLWTHTVCTPVVEDGRVTALKGVFQDVTEKRKAEEKLRSSEALLRHVTESMHDMVALTDAEGRRIWVSPSVRRFGYEPQDLVGTVLLDQVHEDDRAAARNSLAELMRTGGPLSGEFRYRCADGSYVWLESIGKAISSEDGTVTGYIISSRDVSERKHAADVLAASESRFRALFEHSLAPIVVADADGRYLDANPAACRMFGYEREDLLEMRVADLVTPGPDTAGQQFDEYRSSGEGHGEFEFVRADGERRIALWTATEIAPGEHASVLRDITEFKRSEAQLRTEKERAQLYLDIAAVMLLGLDTTGRITLINRRGREILEVGEDDPILGRDWFEFMPEEDRDWVREIHADVTAGNVEEHGRVEARILTVSGDIKRIIWNNSLVRGPDGSIVGTLSSGEDVTALRESEERLRQAQRMEAIGSLAGGVAHDFNNILQVINSFAEMAASGLRDGDPLKADLQEIRDAGARAAALTRQLLAFSRRQVLQPRVIDLNHVLGDLDKMLRRLIGEDVELKMLLAADVDRVFADPGQIEQVLLNLAINARDAMPTGGRLTVETKNVTLDEDYAHQHPDASPGDYVLLAVTDTGSGMDAATMERVFEPFFTTKETGRGTGLGLATVYGIVKQSGGSITVYSEVGHGTTFKVYLPRTAEESVEPPATQEPGDLTGKETVLVVEDEGSVRELIRRTCAGAGYTIIAAANGGEALLECERRNETIDLVLTDVVMPRMSGRELVERLSKIHPELKVLYMSGYTDNTIVHHGVLDESVEFIEKPFTTAKLLAKIRTILDS